MKAQVVDGGVVVTGGLQVTSTVIKAVSILWELPNYR